MIYVSVCECACNTCILQRTEALADPRETPEEIASNFTCAMFETPQDVLKGARHMVRKHTFCITWVMALTNYIVCYPGFY